LLRAPPGAACSPGHLLALRSAAFRKRLQGCGQVEVPQIFASRLFTAAGGLKNTIANCYYFANNFPKLFNRLYAAATGIA
jgi:hypothetical protein